MSISTANTTKLLQISKWLTLLKPLWQVQAFECQSLPWEQAFPRLADKVWQIDDADIDALDVEQQTLVEFLLPSVVEDLNSASGSNSSSSLTIEFTELRSLLCNEFIASIGNDSKSALTETELSHFSAHIKGRKWQQITQFAYHVPLDGLPIVEWCAGKGHLGRYLAKTLHTNVTSLEWQQSLCEQGQNFAKRWQLPQQFCCTDVFKLDENPLKTEQHAVALHACGDLHVRLLNLATEAATQSISFSPCCYHLIEAKQYQPLSDAAKQANFSLSRHDLQLPLQQSVIANQKQLALRHQEICWRLGFDSLQRDATGNSNYLPIPSIKRSQLSGGFVDFCHWAASQKQVDISTINDIEAYFQIGRDRQRLTRRIDLVAHLFRQVLEHWLILDRVCYLEQHHYQVEVFEFCSNSITPRNSLIQAKKR
ncbi:methyltransferase [uncultured Shewanella sp.]|uniref:methyltransferase n=1 Tax=uncultured Shewanella sp. TaxID=173975 RepID=UPI002606C2CE|nr:methyltransferase [uncultured Shewanella sp.]